MSQNINSTGVGGGWRETLKEALRLFFLSIGISNTGGRRLRPDLKGIVSGEGWRVENCSPTMVEHEGKLAIKLAAQPGEGAAWLLNHNFRTGKIDLFLAAIDQQCGILFQSLAADSTDRLTFTFTATGEREIELSLGMTTTNSCLEARHTLPLKIFGEWIQIRVVVSREFLSLFVGGDHVPVLKTQHDYAADRWSRVGIWRGHNAPALLAELRLLETDEWDLN